MSSALVAVSDSPSAQVVIAAWLSGRKATTMDAYKRDLAAWSAWCGLAPDQAVAGLLGLDAGRANAMALAYLAAMKDQGLASATIARRLAALKSLSKVARMIGATDWAIEVTPPKITAYRDTAGPGHDNVAKMIEATDSTRDRAILRFLYDLGLRRGEVVSLDYEHLDLVGHRVSIMGKGRTEREWLTLPKKTQEALAAWLKTRGLAAGPLFTNPGKTRLSGRSVATIVAKAGKRIGVANVRPHGLRHSAITRALDLTDGDVRKAARFSRHKDIRVLTRYDDNRADIAGDIAAQLADES